MLNKYIRSIFLKKYEELCNEYGFYIDRHDICFDLNCDEFNKKDMKFYIKQGINSIIENKFEFKNIIE